ncbi:hypothetical protein AVEN_189372-1 [Araneus ventricosus]|uniref:Uncharacterized protein n=1 Tax=Araneus ventricosus TaxID=182803 RepID=A0A4Y2A1L1_ARAVE|nr:hypothetical protein AVEN_189372-1 [Araneus ventricosus]
MSILILLFPCGSRFHPLDDHCRAVLARPATRSHEHRCLRQLVLQLLSRFSFSSDAACVRELFLSAVHGPAGDLLDLLLQEGSGDQEQNIRGNSCLIPEGGGGQRQRADHGGADETSGGASPVPRAGGGGEEPRDL